MRKSLSASERRFISSSRVCRVGSADRTGRPHVAPLCHVLDGRTIYMATDPSGRTATNLRRRLRASVECDDYFEDWSRLRGIVTEGRARVVRGKAELERARKALIDKFEQYADEEFDYVIAIRIERVASWGL